MAGIPVALFGIAYFLSNFGSGEKIKIIPPQPTIECSTPAINEEIKNTEDINKSNIEDKLKELEKEKIKYEKIKEEEIKQIDTLYEQKYDNLEIEYKKRLKENKDDIEDVKDSYEKEKSLLEQEYGEEKEKTKEKYADEISNLNKELIDEKQKIKDLEEKVKELEKEKNEEMKKTPSYESSLEDYKKFTGKSGYSASKQNSLFDMMLEKLGEDIDQPEKERIASRLVYAYSLLEKINGEFELTGWIYTDVIGDVLKKYNSLNSKDNPKPITNADKTIQYFEQELEK